MRSSTLVLSQLCPVHIPLADFTVSCHCDLNDTSYPESWSPQNLPLMSERRALSPLTSHLEGMPRMAINEEARVAGEEGGRRLGRERDGRGLGRALLRSPVLGLNLTSPVPS
jgi:hypothetical protein